MNNGDLVLVWCYRGYRPGIIRDIGKRTTSIEWANGNQERVANKRLYELTGLKMKSKVYRAFNYVSIN